LCLPGRILSWVRSCDGQRHRARRWSWSREARGRPGTSGCRRRRASVGTATLLSQARRGAKQILGARTKIWRAGCDSRPRFWRPRSACRRAVRCRHARVAASCPTRTGPIIAELAAVGGRRRFRVYHGADLIRDYLEDQIEPLVASPDKGWARRLREKRFADLPEFRARLTAMRLSHPQVDHIYSLRAARIQYVPFQFKPVLRLLRSDQPRLLTADDAASGRRSRPD